MKINLMFALSALVLLASCGKTDEAPKAPAVSTSPPVAAQPAQTPQPLPEVKTTSPESKEPQPKPGQANDHSTPEFKGGKTDSSGK